MATSPAQKPWVNIAIRMIPLLTALGLVLGFAALCDHVLNPPETAVTETGHIAVTDHRPDPDGDGGLLWTNTVIVTPTDA